MAPGMTGAAHGAVLTLAVCVWQHQDYSYWTWTKPQAHLTCWIALDDATAANGTLCYVPGSHRWDLKPVTGLTGDLNAVHAVLSPSEIAEFEAARPMELTRGLANFHHGMMMHGSTANTSDRSRRAAVVNVFRDGVVSNMDGEKQGDQVDPAFPALCS
jgi:ectoine hydroxylase-related dioxygenase (phytanoyl-CoA dioxygenase family)